MKDHVYLDYNATTPCDPRVVDAMLPFFTAQCGNPSSTHGPGRKANAAIENAREQVASMIKASAEEIVFTSGATESINLAIRGFVERQRNYTQRSRIVTTPLEHKAVLETCARVGSQGLEIIMLPVDQNGIVLLDAAAELIDENTLLTSIQASNNEIGIVQPIAEIGEICHRRGVVVHCDATQSVGKLPFAISEANVDLVSFSSHKLYGPKGVGALFIRGGARLSAVAPILDGGGQEKGLRPGTLNTPAIVGFGQACHILIEEMLSESPRIRALRDRLERQILLISSLFRVNASGAERLPNTSSILFPGFEADALLANASQIALSLGSACNNGAVGPSHVLRAIGLSDSDAYSTVRFSLGRFSTEADVDIASSVIATAIKSLHRDGGVSFGR